MSRYSHYQNKKKTIQGLMKGCNIFNPSVCLIVSLYSAFCVPGLSLCSRSFVCVMTSLRGLLALDSGSQNEELSYSRVFKGVPSRYMIGNFCHDPLIINIKIDTEDALQNYMHLLADQGCPHRAEAGCGRCYCCQKLCLLGLQ